MLLKCRFTLWPLSSVMLFAALVVPTATLPKASASGETTTSDPPKPETGIDCAPSTLFPSLRVNCPVTLPATVGLKTTPMAQVAPAASDPLTVPPACGQVVFALVSSENGPVKPTEVKEIALA